MSFFQGLAGGLQKGGKLGSDVADNRATQASTTASNGETARRNAVLEAQKHLGTLATALGNISTQVGAGSEGSGVQLPSKSLLDQYVKTRGTIAKLMGQPEDPEGAMREGQGLLLAATPKEQRTKATADLKAKLGVDNANIVPAAKQTALAEPIRVRGERDAIQSALPPGSALLTAEEIKQDQGARVTPVAERTAGSGVGKIMQDFTDGKIDATLRDQAIAAELTKGQRPNVERAANVKELTTESNLAVQAVENHRTVTEMLALVDQGVKTGFGGELGLKITQAMERAGFEVDQAALANTELFGAMALRFVIPMVKQLGVNPTDKDFQIVQDANANLTKTPEGNRLLLETTKIALERIGIQNRLKNEHFDSGKTLRTFPAVWQKWSNANPMFTPAQRKRNAQIIKNAKNPQAAAKKTDLPVRSPNLNERFNLTPLPGTFP